MTENRVRLRDLLRELSAEATPYIEGLGEPHPFIARLLKTMEWGPKEFKDFIIQKHSQFATDCAGVDASPSSPPGSRIEKLTHKIWLTSTEKPCHPPEEYLTAYIAMCKEHPPEWTHCFWSNSADVLLQVSALSLAGSVKINVLDTHSLHHSSLKTTLERLVVDRKFVLAADVMKFVILDRYGGVYSDLGITFDGEMLEVAAAADYGFFLASNMFFQTSWISLAKESLISSVFLGILNNPEALSVEYALDHSKTVSAGTEVHTFAGLGFTACALLFLPSEARVFAFPQTSSHLTWRSQQSWYGNAAKHGNVLINDSLPSVIEETRYATLASEARQRVHAFNANGRLIEMARILVRLFDYFQRNETRLSKLLAYEGSDKAGGWHNYGYLYSFLFGIVLKRGCCLLEIGDARSLWGSPTATEPGRAPVRGSIGVWKEYLKAVTFGVEIERSDSEESVLEHPVLVNGTDRMMLMDELRVRRYDVIIDNGLHYFEATVALLETALPRLDEAGIYVIEAVPLIDIERWRAYLQSTAITGLLFKLPHPSNQSDNCMIVLFNTASLDGGERSQHVLGYPTWSGTNESPILSDAASPPVRFSERLQSSSNMFRDTYSSLSDDEWKSIWLSTEGGTNISGIEFPAIPDPELQLQFHGSSSWATSMTEAFDFYSFVKRKIDFKAGLRHGRFLDYGCGWGRMMRPFMRDFDLNKMFGFEPNLRLATISRGLNPYISVFSGGYAPDGSIPENWFDVVIGWSIFSHLSRSSCQQWLGEIARILTPGGTAVFTTWGLRFLRRLQAEEKQLREGGNVHWYSKMCIETAGNIAECISRFERGDFVWFTNTDSDSYGEAFLSEMALREIIQESDVPLHMVDFDSSALDQDVFIVRRG